MTYWCLDCTLPLALTLTLTLTLTFTLTSHHSPLMTHHSPNPNQVPRLHLRHAAAAARSFAALRADAGARGARGGTQEGTHSARTHTPTHSEAPLTAPFLPLLTTLTAPLLPLTPLLAPPLLLPYYPLLLRKNPLTAPPCCREGQQEEDQADQAAERGRRRDARRAADGRGAARPV